MRFALISFLILLTSPTTALADSAIQTRKLIEFGWDEPDTAFMRAHLAEMEATPFDGCVFHINYLKDGKADGRFLAEAWGKHAFTRADVQPALDDLRATPFKRFTENFLRFDVTPGDVDWFDDPGFSTIAGNARLAATLAHEGHARGILFDVEEYEFHLFTYSKLLHAKDRSWADYAAQARRRGAQVMRAFQEGYPGVTVFLTFGYTLPYLMSGHDPAKLPAVQYGLLAPFMDGMVDAAGSETTLVDGYEPSYGFKTADRFETIRRAFESGVLPYVADPDRYHARCRLGFGLWMDNDWRKHGWDPSDVSKNYFTPAQFQASASLALRYSDEYVWIYTEKPQWWTPAGKPRDLPPGYESALRDAIQQTRSAQARSPQPRRPSP